MQHKFKLATLSSLLCANAFATPVYLPPGSNLTYGSSSNNQSIMSSVANPAAAAADLSKEDSQYRFGIISVGAGYEIGNVNDLYNKIDSATADLKTLTDTQQIPTSVVAFLSPGVVDVAATSANIANYINTLPQTQTVNSVLSEVQENGYATVFANASVPFTPMVVTKKGLGGSIVFDASVSVVADMFLIADPIFISSATATAIAQSYNVGTGTFASITIPNDTTLLVKAVAVGEVGLGYSRPVLSRESGVLTAGVRGKYYQVKLARAAQRQQDATDDSQSTLTVNQTYASSSDVGLDVGTLWNAKRYRVGAWVNNINTPSFKYPAIDTSKWTNQNIIALIQGDEVYKMKPQLELEGAVFSESQNWVLNAGLDANAVEDPVGRDFQWATLSAAYATKSWWIPGIRVGYRANLAGTKLSYVTGGLTLFKALSLDIAFTPETVTDNNGNSYPRSAMINLGFQMTF